MLITVTDIFQVFFLIFTIKINTRMKHLKTRQQLNDVSENLNISDVSNSVFSITEEQLEKLIEKVKDKITDTLDKEGKSTKGLAITNSVSDTIKSYLKKHCC